MNTHKNLRYFLYARKSSENEDRQVQSLDDQTNLLKTLAKNQGLQIVQIYTESKSAKMPYVRPLYLEMVKRIEKGEADGILCWAMNRLFRNPVDQGTIGWMLQSEKIKCIQTIDRKYLPDDNVLLFNVEGGMANQYIIDLRKMCKRGLQSKVQKGWMPSRPPIGYLNNIGEKIIDVDTERFELVRKMWDLMLTGVYNPCEITDIANIQWGFRTYKYKRNGGTPIAKSSMYRLFSNIFYTGLFEYGGVVYQGKHKPMISVQEFEKVQYLLNNKDRNRRTSHDFAFTGLLECNLCGSKYTASKKTKLVKTTNKMKSYTYYHCSRKGNKGKCNSKIQKPLTEMQLDLLICSELEKYKIPNIFLELVFKLIDQLVKNKCEFNKKRTESLEKAKTQTESDLDNLKRQFYRELIDEDFFLKEKEVLVHTLAQLNEQTIQKSYHGDDILKLIKDAFTFPSFAIDTIKTDSLKAKKIVLRKFGSNWQLNGKILDFIRAEWIKPIKELTITLKAEKRRFELNKSYMLQRFNDPNDPLFLQMRGIIEVVRTEIVSLKDKNPEFEIHEQEEEEN